MSKIKDIIIIDKYTLRLNTDCKKGDEIDLRDLGHVDTSLIQAQIDEAKDQEYNRRLNALKKEMELEKQNKIQMAISEKEKIIASLTKEIENQEKLIRSELENNFIKEKSDLNQKIQKLITEKDQVLIDKDKDIQIEVAKNIAALKEELTNLKNQLKALEKEKINLLEKAELEAKMRILEKEKSFEESLKEKEEAIAKLRLEKTMLNIKKMGEELEKWVNEEYEFHSLNGFEKCDFSKDNEAIKAHGEAKGTKADYLFKVYASETKNPNELLTSVAIEIKSEDPSSTYKKKNADHYEKLDKDREKKNCEYALLISELEWESVNDAPIRKIQEYPKMYMVRPQYFIVFLNIVTALALKYQDILLEYNLERVKFKDSEDILTEFETLKSEILDRSITYIENKMNEINDSATNIIKEAKDILENSRVVLDTHLRTVINKIEKFKINQIVKQIEKLD